MDKLKNNSLYKKAENMVTGNAQNQQHGGQAPGYGGQAPGYAGQTAGYGGVDTSRQQSNTTSPQGTAYPGATPSRANNPYPGTQAQSGTAYPGSAPQSGYTDGSTTYSSSNPTHTGVGTTQAGTNTGHHHDIHQSGNLHSTEQPGVYQQGAQNPGGFVQSQQHGIHNAGTQHHGNVGGHGEGGVIGGLKEKVGHMTGTQHQGGYTGGEYRQDGLHSGGQPHGIHDAGLQQQSGYQAVQQQPGYGAPVSGTHTGAHASHHTGEKPSITDRAKDLLKGKK
jgi:hypothetical protein